MNICDKITLAFPTHFRGDFDGNYVKKTIESLHDKTSNLLKETKHYIMYSHSDWNQDVIIYTRYLQQCLLELDLPSVEIHHVRGGMGGIYKQLLYTVPTPYMFFIEHDWEFVKDINIIKIINCMDKHNKINYIRFNKRKNGKLDFPLSPEEDFHEVSLLRIARFSNNPHILRIKWAREKLAKTIVEIEGRARGVEESIQKYLLLPYLEKHSIESCYSEYGLYLLGEIDEEAYVAHLDGYHREKKTLKRRLRRKLERRVRRKLKRRVRRKLLREKRRRIRERRQKREQEFSKKTA